MASTSRSPQARLPSKTSVPIREEAGQEILEPLGITQTANLRLGNEDVQTILRTTEKHIEPVEDFLEAGGVFDQYVGYHDVPLSSLFPVAWCRQ